MHVSSTHQHGIAWPRDPSRQRVLCLLRDTDPISRTEIAQLLKLSKPTVSDIVDHLIAAGFLETHGQSESTKRGGRKRELLKFKPDAGYVVAVDIRRGRSVAAVTDLHANILARKTIDYPIGTQAKMVLREIEEAIVQLFASEAAIHKRTLGIGIGLPGLIDRERGTVQVADTLAGWTGVSLRSAFSDRFHLPLFAENDVKARAIGEFLFGRGKSIPNQVFLWIGDGIGAGIIINNSLHHGVTESAGEIGYNAIYGTERIPLLYNGQRDFGEILSNRIILERYAAHAGAPVNGSVLSLFRREANGDILARDIIEEVVHVTSVVCINLINTLNPELVLIGGELVEAGDAYLSRVQQRVRDDILSAPAEAVRIEAAGLQEDGVICGAAGLVLNAFFQCRSRTSQRIENSENVYSSITPTIA